MSSTAVWIERALLAAGLVLLAGSFLDIGSVLAANAPDGSVSAAYVDAVRFRMRACGAGLLLVALLGRVLPRDSTAARLEISQPPYVLLAIALLARLALIARPLRYDEAFTLTEFSSRSPLFFLSSYTHPNNHVLHTLLVWLMPGDALPVLRLPALIAGLGVVWATYLLAKQTYDRATALFAAALAAGTTPLVEYSAQARGYTILTLCFAGLFLVTPHRWRLAALLIALGGWTMPTMMYACAAWAAWVIASERPVPWRALASSAIAGAALAFVLYVPILVITGPDSITSNGTVLPVSYDVLARELPRTIAETWKNWNLSFTQIGGILLGALAVFTIVRERGRNALLISVAVVLLMTILTRRVPFPRVWTFLVPLYLIAAAHGLAVITRRRAPYAIAIALAVVTCISAVHVTSRRAFYEDPAMRDAPAVAAWIRANAPADAQILVTSPLDAPYAFYLPDRNLLKHRFDSIAEATRAAFTAPRRYFIASRRQHGMDEYHSLRIEGALQPVRAFEHSIVYEIR